MKAAVGTLATLFLIYGGISALAFFFQRALLYFPDTSVGTPAGAGVPDMRTVHLQTRDGLSLKSWYAKAQPGKATLVYFHGNAGTIAGRGYKARVFMDAGYGVLLVEYRGYGDNPGRPTEAGLYADADAAMDFLLEQGLSQERIIVYGESLGSGVATQLASEHPVRAVILEAPYTSITAVASRAYWYLPVGMLLKDRFESINRIGAIHAPLLIIHGEDDRTVPVDLGRALFAAAEDPKDAVWIPNAGHADLYEHGAGEAVVAWLAEAAQSEPP